MAILAASVIPFCADMKFGCFFAAPTATGSHGLATALVVGDSTASYVPFPWPASFHCAAFTPSVATTSAVGGVHCTASIRPLLLDPVNR